MPIPGELGNGSCQVGEQYRGRTERFVSYWEERKGYTYLREVRNLAETVAPHARSIIDVGSNGCPYLEWFTQAHYRVSIDLTNPYRSDTVEGLAVDFLEYEQVKPFDLCLCLQVLEHVPEPRIFARKLLATAEHVVASVPFRWPRGFCADHVHDPVDEKTLLSWFGRPPARSVIAEEPRKGPNARRLICHYCSTRL